MPNSRKTRHNINSIPNATRTGYLYRNCILIPAFFLQKNRLSIDIYFFRIPENKIKCKNERHKNNMHLTVIFLSFRDKK